MGKEAVRVRSAAAGWLVAFAWVAQAEAGARAEGGRPRSQPARMGRPIRAPSGYAVASAHVAPAAPRAQLGVVADASLRSRGLRRRAREGVGIVEGPTHDGECAAGGASTHVDAGQVSQQLLPGQRGIGRAQ